jgi:hypothetical protein
MSFVRHLTLRHSDYIWEFSNSFLLFGIDPDVTCEQIKKSIALALVQAGRYTNEKTAMGTFQVEAIRQRPGLLMKWKAWLKFHVDADKFVLTKMARKAKGITVLNSSDMPCLQDLSAITKLEYETARAAYDVSKYFAGLSFLRGGFATTMS